MNKKLFIALFVVTSLAFSTVYSAQMSSAQREPIATLTYKTNGGGFRPDYGLFTQQYLAEIGIKVNVKVEEWIVFVGTLLVTQDFDLAFVALVGGAGDPDPYAYMGEDGSLNMYGMNTEMPYGNQSEQMLKEGVTILDLDERQQHYYEWQQLVMDKIVPLLPFYSPRAYTATWANLEGYDQRWGTIACFPYMSFDGTHEGQTNNKEFNTHDANWKELNPLFQDDASSSYISSLVMEPIIQLNPDYEALKTGLVEDWVQIADDHYKFTMREGVYWNPSYNVTGRDGSTDLSEAPLMEGITGLTSDGTNQEVTAKDAVFTYLAWGYPGVSEDSTYVDWISDIYVDPDDKYSFHMFVDGNPDTEEIEPYAPFWTRLSWRIFPEFFLNDTTSVDVVETAGGVEFVGLYEGIESTPAWVYYSTSAFGCGKYMLDYYVRGSITVLQASPYWFGIGAIDGTVQTLDIETINIRVIPDQTSALAEFKAGKLDIMGLTSFPAERKQAQQDDRFLVQSMLQGYFSFIGFNMRRPFIGGTDNFVFLEEPGYEEYTRAVAVRKAISYAIDREEINNVLHEGEYLISDSPIYPIQDFWYYNDIIKYRYDIDAALQWLSVAGWIEYTPLPTPFMFIGVIAAIASFCLFRKKKR